MIPWPYKSVLEGQGETKWFYGGKIVVVGYGFRSSKQSVSDLEEILNKIYKRHGLEPPVVLGVKLLDPRYYHMDVAAHAISWNECLLHAGAIGDQDVQMMENRSFLRRPFCVELRNGKRQTLHSRPHRESEGCDEEFRLESGRVGRQRV